MDKPYQERTGGSYVRDKDGSVRKVAETLPEPEQAPPAAETSSKKGK